MLDPAIGGGALCTFRTDVPQATQQSWWMYRDINPIGRVWNDATHRAFHLQSMLGRDDGQDRYSGVMIQNEESDGLWIMNDGTPTGGRAFPNPLQLLDAKGYAALGYQAGWLFPGATNPRGPWSRFHLFHNVTGTRPLYAFRPQMKNGVTFTGNSDLAYVGQWYDQGEDGTGTEVDDHSDLVLGIGEQAVPEGLAYQWDNISFRLFGDMDAPMGASGNVEGQELMRIQPVRPTSNDDPEAHVGIGDFLTAADVPSEALDVLTGKVRIRQLPSDATSSSNELVTVNMTTGVLEHKPAGTLPDNCEWSFDSPSTYNVITASGSSSGCPGDANTVGIGGSHSDAKLYVYNDRQRTNPVAIYARSFANAACNNSNLCGIIGEVNDQGPYAGGWQYGVDGRAHNGTVMNMGLRGEATGGPRSYGVAGFANSSTSGNYGIYGNASGTNAWAGWFDGAVYINGPASCTASAWTSDASLKTNVQDIQDAGDLLAQLHPKTYEFIAHPTLALPSGSQLGLVAQEVGTVLPELVQDMTIPAQFDSTGTETSAPETIKTLNYIGLIPLLIAGYQEQQAQIAELRDQLALCCTAREQRSTLQGNGSAAGAVTEALTIAPNPFTDRTTVRYTVPRPGRVRLEVATQDGRKLEVLREEKAQQGTFTYEWNTTGLAAGTYLVTLLLDDQVVVKRAVKVTR